MLTGTVCRLLRLLLHGGLTVAVTMRAFPCLALLASGAAPLLVNLLAINKTFVVFVPTFPLCFHPMACVVFVSSTALQTGLRSSHRSSVTPRCRLLACSIVGFTHSLVPSLFVYDVEQCVGLMHYEIEPHLPFHHAANSGGTIPAAIALSLIHI